MSNQNVWKIDENDFTFTKDLRGKINFWLKYAVLAASAHNTQPWSCRVEDEILYIDRDQGRTLGTDYSTRLAHIGLGAFIENLSIASQHCGFTPSVLITAQTTEKLEVAKISFKKASKMYKDGGERLFRAITNRHTNRGLYLTEKLDKSLINNITKKSIGVAETIIISDTNSKTRIGKLVAKSTEIALSLPVMKRELADFVYSLRDPKEVGMPIESMLPSILSGLISPKTAVRFINPRSLGEDNLKKYSRAPVLVIIGTYEDGPSAWIDAGRLMQQVLLEATASGCSHDIAAGPIEVPTILPALRLEIKFDLRPQVLLRIGRAKYPSLSVSSGRRLVTV